MRRLTKMTGVVITMALAVVLTACGQQNVSGTGSEAPDTTPVDTLVATTEIEEEAVLSDPFAECEYLTQEMYDNATSFIQGDETRIAAAMRKALAGEEVTVGVIGGSITQGSSASSTDKCYASLLKKWWEETFPDATINFINAGVGGTSSYLGVHRVEEDLLTYNPDFVVVEFSVNDSDNNFYKKSYDNLVYRIMQWESEPAVVLLFMTMEDGTSAQEADSLIGFQYQLPMLSYRNAVLPEIEAGNFTWKDISPDNIHPNTRGHQLIGEIFDVYLTDVYNRLDEFPETATVFGKDIITKEAYQNATILNCDTIEPTEWGSFEHEDVSSRFTGNWTTRTGEGSIIFETEAANIGIMYQKFTDGNGGQFEVYVDNVLVATLNADFSGGWGQYGETVEVYASDEIKLHTIEIRKKEDSSGNAFSILGLMVS